MATTTNYSWTTPDDTALVKDGAAAIRSLGTAIDTTVFNNAGASIAKTIVDAKGDIIAATAADTVSRLAVGANDTVLTADSTAATGLKWATVAGGGMTLLSTTTLSGASTTISSINQTYNNLYILVRGVTNDTSTNNFYCRPNSASTTSYQALEGSTIRTGNTDWNLTGDANHSTRTDANNSYALQIFNYSSTTSYKPIFWTAYYQQSGASRSIVGGGGFYSNTAVSSILFANAGGDLLTGTVLIYGVK